MKDRAKATITSPSGKLITSLKRPPSHGVYEGRDQYKADQYQLRRAAACWKWTTRRARALNRQEKGNPHVRFSWDPNLPLHQIHWPISSFGWFCIESLDSHPCKYCNKKFLRGRDESPLRTKGPILLNRGVSTLLIMQANDKENLVVFELYTLNLNLQTGGLFSTVCALLLDEVCKFLTCSTRRIV